MTAAAHRIEPAHREDDAGIRALLRHHPMGDRVRITLEREPSFDRGAGTEGERHHAFVLRASDGRTVVGLAIRSVSSVWVDGRPRLLGYLSQLRRDERLVLTRGVVAAGFAACEATREEDELPFDLTSVLADNSRARRLLERGLPGLPVYEPLTELVTATIDVRAARRRRPIERAGLEIDRATPDAVGRVAGFLQRTLSAHPLAPVWTEADLLSPRRTHGLELEDFRLATRSGRLVGCLALWDQRSFKQTVVRGYSRWLDLARPVLNPAAAILGRPRLPEPGAPLSLAFLSHMAVADEDPRTLLALVDAIVRSSDCEDLDLVCIGLAATSPLLPNLVRAFRPRELRSVLYRAYPRGRGVDVPLGPGTPQVEVARL